VSVLERVTLDQKRSLFVVEAAGEILLVGGGDGSLSLISKLDRAEVDKLRAASPSQPLQLSPFLQKLLGRKDAPPPPTV
jgi:flagellar biogenesis protein FliO